MSHDDEFSRVWGAAPDQHMQSYASARYWFEQGWDQGHSAGREKAGSAQAVAALQSQTGFQAALIDALLALLQEARGRVTDKPWDDPVRLHDRLSDALGLPRSYPDHPRDGEDA